MNDFANLKGLFETAQRLESEMARVKDELGRKTASGESGGGLCRCTVNGRGEVLEIVIEPALLAAGEGGKKMLEDLVAGAVNVALDRGRQLAQDELARVGGGLPIPPGLFPGFGGEPSGGS